MARITYVSRSSGAHDRRWIALLSSAGHVVRDLGGRIDVAEIRASPADLVVAGPVTDALPAAVEAAVAPVLAMVWAFDLLVEARDEAVRGRTVEALRRAAGVHVDCAAMHALVAGLGVEERRISQAPWGIDTAFFAPGDDAPRAATPFTVLSTRAWEPLYRIDLVLDAFARARRSVPEMRLVLAGSGSLEPELRARAGAPDLAGSVRIVGRLTPGELLEHLHHADAYVSAAQSDGTSLSALEALSCGVPVVAPAVGGNPEWISSGLQGRLFAADDEASLADALLDLRTDPRLHAAAERRGSILERADGTRNGQVFLDAVEELLHPR
ncbi:MAG: glycosyltransferase [Nocardioides sp.]